MMNASLPDSRTAPYRPDLASSALRHRVSAPVYVDPWVREITADVVPVRAEPCPGAMQVTQALYGEQVSVCEERDGWAWVQIETDDYTGYLRTSSLGPATGDKCHKVTALRTYLYSDADLKSPPLGLLSLGSRFSVKAETNGFYECANGGFIHHCHGGPRTETEPDFVAVAERFTGTPYLWGGRSSIGLDCSALVQLALAAAGIAAPRDSDMQLELGSPLPIGEIGNGNLARGDLVFWSGHLGIMADETRLLHANAHHMAVAAEPLAETVERISASGSEVIGARRLASGISQ